MSVSIYDSSAVGAHIERGGDLYAIMLHATGCQPPAIAHNSAIRRSFFRDNSDFLYAFLCPLDAAQFIFFLCRHSPVFHHLENNFPPFPILHKGHEYYFQLSIDQLPPALRLPCRVFGNAAAVDSLSWDRENLQRYSRQVSFLSDILVQHSSVPLPAPDLISHDSAPATVRNR